MVLDYIAGRPLTKKILRDSSEDCRRLFFEKVVDIFAQLRRLEFPLGGSLMPNPTAGIWNRLRKFVFLREESLTPQSTIGPELELRIADAFSMRKNELQVDGYIAPCFIATTAKEFLEEHYHLLQYMWKMPSQELGREEARKSFGLMADTSGDSFYPCHPDLRVNNIIEDDELHVCGIIDWEFSVTVPRHAFLPPSWITGYDAGSVVSRLDLLSEFMTVLSSRKQLSLSHSQLAQDGIWMVSVCRWLIYF